MTADELQRQFSERLPIPALANPAIVCCRDAMERSCREAMKELKLMDEKGNPVEPTPSGTTAEQQRELEVQRAKAERAIKNSYKAYREALPPLHGSENIRDFIACVAHGMAIEVFDVREASKMLYAAQVAAAAQPRPGKTDFL